MVTPPPVEIEIDPSIGQFFPTDLDRFSSEVQKHIKDNIDELLPLLGNYCSDVRGTVDSASIQDESLWIDASGRGTMVADTEESAYYGCRDANRADFNEVELSLRYDPVRGVLIVSGRDVPERDPDEF